MFQYVSICFNEGMAMIWNSLTMFNSQTEQVQKKPLFFRIGCDFSILLILVEGLQKVCCMVLGLSKALLEKHANPCVEDYQVTSGLSFCAVRVTFDWYNYGELEWKNFYK